MLIRFRYVSVTGNFFLNIEVQGFVLIDNVSQNIIAYNLHVGNGCQR